jgi:hypothetical protein
MPVSIAKTTDKRDSTRGKKPSGLPSIFTVPGDYRMNDPARNPVPLALNKRRRA